MSETVEIPGIPDGHGNGYLPDEKCAYCDAGRMFAFMSPGFGPSHFCTDCGMVTIGGGFLPSGVTRVPAASHYVRSGKWALCLNCHTLNAGSWREHYCGAPWQHSPEGDDLEHASREMVQRARAASHSPSSQPVEAQ